MGWFAIAKAIKEGTGPYGSVREALRGEVDPPASLRVALAEIQREIDLGEYHPDRGARARLAYWRKKYGKDDGKHKRGR